ncbi:MAG: protein kinase [Chloroflexi bacterium]|nr:protein kinase [Chloroflexota bacterium]
MSKVFKAYHPGLNRHAAIKVLNPELSSDMDFVNLFHIEAKSLAHLNHPNIVKVYDTGVQRQLLYIVMEYINGKSLRLLIDEYHEAQETIPIREAVLFIKSLGNALSYAHKLKIIHRDVKPGNVLVEKTGRVVLADFGLAKVITGATEMLTGTLRGAPAYMAPEVLKFKMSHSMRNYGDVYSLGVIFYELTVGKRPYNSEKPVAVALKQINEPLPKPRSVTKSVPRKVETIIIKALEKNPAKRYKNMAAMVGAIEKLKEAKTTHLPTGTLGLSDKLALEDLLSVTPTKLQITLHFLRTGQILELPYGTEFSIGRKNKNPPNRPDIDLTPFKGFEWGISRSHAKLIVGKRDVKLVDLKSTNGTWFDGKKLKPNKPLTLNHGDTISLGKLQIQVLIYMERLAR